jgi:hypothetical protein
MKMLIWNRPIPREDWFRITMLILGLVANQAMTHLSQTIYFSRKLPTITRRRNNKKNLMKIPSTLIMIGKWPSKTKVTCLKQNPYWTRKGQ